MTRFVGESLATRSGRNSHALFGKDRAKAMKQFQETGKHPLIEQTLQQNAASAVAALPTLDINRPHVFLNLTQQGKLLGRLIVELFEDIYPVVCATFRHRCLEGFHTIKGTAVHEVQPQFAIFAGRLAGANVAPVPPASLQKRPLHHSEAGLLSVAHDGTHFAVTLARALPLDAHYKVIGRVGKGSEVLAQLNGIVSDTEGAPEHPITVSQCGTTDHRGNNESLSAAGATSASAAAENMRGNLAGASAGVADALAAGLKRKPGHQLDRGPRKSAHEQSAGPPGATQKKRKGAAGALHLDDLGSDSDSDDDGG